jgi:hypothetical protein
MIPHTNPFIPLRGSLVTLTPRKSRLAFQARGLFESSFIALIVNAPVSRHARGGGGSFKTRIFYKDSLYEFYLYPDEVSPIP